MSVEALWSVSFQSNFGMRGDGIVVFESGRVLGGDSVMIYTGHYKIHGEVSAEVHVRRYAANPGLTSVVGLEDYNLRVSGKYHEQQMTLIGAVVEDRNRQISLQLVRRAELP